MKTVSIELDKERNLKLTNNGIQYIDERLKLNLYEGKDIFTVSPFDLKALLFGLLKHEDTNLTEEQVGDMIGPENLTYVSERITALVEAITPKPDKKKSPKAVAATAEAGSTEDRPQ